jgi:hypothetical protein
MFDNIFNRRSAGIDIKLGPGEYEARSKLTDE